MADLISGAYQELNAALHQGSPDYGSFGHRWAPSLQDLIAKSGYSSVLDYGCGKNTLLARLKDGPGAGLDMVAYDPAIPEFATPPRPCDLVVCTDVLEHIEPAAIEAVLDDLRRLSLKAAFCVVSTRPARRTLPDGRNAHLIQESYRWWLPKFWQRWDVRVFRQNSFQEPDDEFIVYMTV